jgi:ribosome-binding protein aMBF1 (putative translation factor)
MAKYSTGDGGRDAGGSCELCGSSDVDLETASVAGATLQVCSSCASHGESRGPAGGSSGGSRGGRDGGRGGGSGGGGGGGDGGHGGENRKKKAARNTARIHDAAKGDSTHWEEEGTDYEDDRLPYLVGDYGERLTAARQEAGYQLEELAAELDVDEADLLAVEQGRATQAGVGGTLVRRLEEALGVDLIDE